MAVHNTFGDKQIQNVMTYMQRKPYIETFQKSLKSTKNKISSTNKVYSLFKHYTNNPDIFFIVILYEFYLSIRLYVAISSSLRLVCLYDLLLFMIRLVLRFSNYFIF